MSRAFGEEYRRADALRAGGAMARLVVGDQARALLVSGHWLEAAYHLVNAEGRSEGTPTHWVSVSGDVVPAATVAAVRLARGPRPTKFAEEVDDITGRARCPGSGEPAEDEWTEANDDGNVAMAYCPECENTVPAPAGRYAEHDRRGRHLPAAE